MQAGLNVIFDESRIETLVNQTSELVSPQYVVQNTKQTYRVGHILHTTTVTWDKLTNTPHQKVAFGCGENDTISVWATTQSGLDNDNCHFRLYDPTHCTDGVLPCDTDPMHTWGLSWRAYDQIPSYKANFTAYSANKKNKCLSYYNGTAFDYGKHWAKKAYVRKMKFVLANPIKVNEKLKEIVSLGENIMISGMNKYRDNPTKDVYYPQPYCPTYPH